LALIYNATKFIQLKTIGGKMADANSYSEMFIDSDNIGVKNSKDIDPLTMYLKQISAYPLLTKQQELELGEEIQLGKKRIDELECEYKSGKIDKELYLNDYTKVTETCSIYCQKISAQRPEFPRPY
jgi:hypothetical protein